MNIAKFLKTPLLKNICERLLLRIVNFSQENNHMQRCFDLPEPKLHRERACVMLVHSPQTTFHRKIIYNFVWIYLGRSSRPDVFCKKSVLRNIAKLTGKHLWQSLFFNKVSGLCKEKDSGTGIFSEFCEISNNTFFFTEHLRWLLLSGPTTHKETTCEMLAYGLGTTFMKKIIYTMLCWPCWTDIA